MITLKDGTQVTEEEFFTWSANRQRGQVIGMPAEVRAKIGASVSASTKGKPKSAEHRAKLLANHLGKKRSAETKAKQSASKLNRTPEQKAASLAKKLATQAAKRAANPGQKRGPYKKRKVTTPRTMGEEAKAKQRASRLANIASGKTKPRTISPEHRTKLLAATAARHAANRAAKKVAGL